MAFETTQIPELELCSQCHVSWDEHPIRCMLKDCELITLHCHKIEEIGGVVVRK